jgi:hypothetical protein
MRFEKKKNRARLSEHFAVCVEDRTVEKRRKVKEKVFPLWFGSILPALTSTYWAAEHPLDYG